jgi:hypothetical protein
MILIWRLPLSTARRWLGDNGLGWLNILSFCCSLSIVAPSGRAKKPALDASFGIFFADYLFGRRISQATKRIESLH